jgi:hypothetical protein
MGHYEPASIHAYSVPISHINIDAKKKEWSAAAPQSYHDVDYLEPAPASSGTQLCALAAATTLLQTRRTCSVAEMVCYRQRADATERHDNY